MATQICTHASIGSRNQGSIRVVICDRDAIVRAQLRALIDLDSMLAVVAECSDWAQCQAEIDELGPDLLIARSDLLPAERLHQYQQDCFAPILVTLRDAADATFGGRRSDFLAVPADAAVIQRALDQAVSRVYDRKAKQLLHLVSRYVTGSPASNGYRLVIQVERGGERFELDVSQVMSVVAARKHVVVHTMVGDFTVREPIRSLADKLDPRNFVRIHRSIIVNRRHVKSTASAESGSNLVTLSDGSQHPVGPNYRDALADIQDLPHAIAS